MSAAEVPKQIHFISTIFDFPVIKASRSKSYKDAWGAMRSFMQKWVPNGTPLRERFGAGAPIRSITTLEKRLIQDCVTTFYIRVKTVKQCHAVRKDEGNPVIDILETNCKMFIGCFNSYLSSMDGLYVEKYGIVKAEELRIENGKVFMELLQEAVDHVFMPKKIKRVAKTYLAAMNENQTNQDAEVEEINNN